MGGVFSSLQIHGAFKLPPLPRLLCKGRDCKKFTQRPQFYEIIKLTEEERGFNLKEVVNNSGRSLGFTALSGLKSVVKWQEN